MKHRSKSPLPAKLAQGLKCFQQWRNKRKPRTRLPDHLWSLATKLAREFGLNPTASALRLGYYGLKKRLERPVRDDASADTTNPSFLELRPVEATPDAECTIECQNAAGTQIRIQLRGRDLPDLTVLCGELWSRHQ
jgi:hypothetical protein